MERTPDRGSEICPECEIALRRKASASARPSDIESLAIDVHQMLHGRGLTLGVAESLTGGMVTAALVAVPGASSILRGAIVAYATDVKAELLGVSRALLDRTGPVSGEVAVEMARGAVRHLRADVGVAVTGVAGPAKQDGVGVGTVFVAVSGCGREGAVRHSFEGDRGAIREQACQAALDLVCGSLINLGLR